MAKVAQHSPGLFLEARSHRDEGFQPAFQSLRDPVVEVLARRILAVEGVEVAQALLEDVRLVDVLVEVQQLPEPFEPFALQLLRVAQQQVLGALEHLGIPVAPLEFRAQRLGERIVGVLDDVESVVANIGSQKVLALDEHEEALYLPARLVEGADGFRVPRAVVGDKLDGVFGRRAPSFSPASRREESYGR